MTNTIKTHCVSAAFAVLLAVAAFAVPAHAADAIFPTGSRVGLVPPGDMTPSKMFEGFADPQKSASILISTLPAGARLGNFTLKKETARIGRPSMAGTTTPKPSNGWLI